ncbi:hypothetical protein [Paenibacillus sp. FSL E2-0178]|uniref:hypothetical protein n=1 Tax=Paenibacillus sp. FSL E2-0178 TaxID=2921361 RepID=UPI00315836FA
MYKKNIPTSVIAFLIILIFFSCSTRIEASSKVIPPDSYVSDEIAVFFNGQIIISPKKTFNIDTSKYSGTYIPLKLLNELPKVTVNFSNPITIKTENKTSTINQTDTFLYDNTTYITLNKLYEVTGFTGKYVYDPNSLFLWSSADGETKSKNLINQINNVTYDFHKSFMGKKVYVYDEDISGWVISMEKSISGLTNFKIQLKNGKVIEELAISEVPDSFCTEFDTVLINARYNGKYYWADKTQLPSSNPLINIEKVYFTSVKIKGREILIAAKRNGGASVTFKIPIKNDPFESIKSNFYTENPKSTYPGWSTDMWNKIAQQKISVGMTPEQVLLSWGGPNDINSYTSKNTRIEQWIYGNTYLHFYNGNLESWSKY